MTTDALPLQFHFTQTVEPPPEEPSPYATMLGWLDERLGPAGPTGQQDKVLVVGHRDDVQQDRVVLELLRRGVPVCRFYPQEFAGNSRVTLRVDARGGTDGLLALPLSSLPLHEVQSVWYRQPWLPPVDALYEGVLQGTSTPDDLAQLEIGGALRAFFDLLESAFWVSRPEALRGAASPLDVLRRAARTGLGIPRTVLTSDPRLARAFFDECGGKIVVKPLHRWRGRTAGGMQQLISGVVERNDVDLLDRVQAAPCLLQEHISADRAISVVIFGHHLFAAGYPLSEGPSAHWAPYTLPGEVETAIVEVLQGYGLQSSRVRLLRRPDGEHVALELDGDAEWLELEEQTGLPLVPSMADLLERGAPQ